MVRSIALCFAALLFWAVPASAQRSTQTPDVAPPVDLVWMLGAPSRSTVEEGRARRWLTRLSRALERDGHPVRTHPESWAYRESPLAAEDLSVLVAIESLLMRAADARARLQPSRAFARLSEAERLLRANLILPGAAAWFAEIQLGIAITAGEVGRLSMADRALLRAASVDPARVLRAAEVNPQLIQRADELRRQIRLGPRSRFEVRSDPPGANVILDDTLIGATPIDIETSVGTHLMRLESPGFRTYARLVDVLEGPRLPIDITLAPDLMVQRARALATSVSSSRIREIPNNIRDLGAFVRRTWLLEVSGGALDRAIVVSCDSASCGIPIEMDTSRAESRLDFDGPPVGYRARALRESRAWLDEPLVAVEESSEPSPPQWWGEPVLWIAVGVSIAGASIGIIAATWPDSPTRREVFVDPSGLPGWSLSSH